MVSTEPLFAAHGYSGRSGTCVCGLRFPTFRELNLHAEQEARSDSDQLREAVRRETLVDVLNTLRPMRDTERAVGIIEAVFADALEATKVRELHSAPTASNVDMSNQGMLAGQRPATIDMATPPHKSESHRKARADGDVSASIPTPDDDLPDWHPSFGGWRR